MYSFPNLEPACCSVSSSNYCFLTCIQISQEACKVVGIPISLRIFHSLLWSTVKDFSVVNEAEVDAFLAISLANGGSLISGSSAFSKSSLYIWKFSVHVMLNPSLKDFEHYLASMWNKHNCTVVWTFFDCDFFGIVMKTDLFQSCGHCWIFQIC